MKKVLALVLALVMVCTLAMAITESTTGEVKTTTTVDAKGYTLYDLADKTNQTYFKMDAGTIKITTTTPKVYTKDDKVTTTYYADKYEMSYDWTKFDNTNGHSTEVYSAVDASAADYKLVKDGKIVAFLLYNVAEVNTTAVVSKEVKFAEGDKIVCGDYDVDGSNDGTTTTGKAVKTTLYIINDKAYKADGANWAVLNGAFVKVDMTDDIDVIHHDFDANKFSSEKSVKTSVYCKSCDKYIPVVETAKIPATTLDQYAAVTGHNGYSYLVKAVGTTTTTTNPDTGANDVIGVAAALAVVALVSGAAISLKK